MTPRGGSRTPASTGPSDVSFEVAIERLEGVVDRLEQGELELEQALVAFEDGVALARHCALQLEQAERRIDVLVKEGERTVTRPFEDGDGGEESD